MIDTTQFFAGKEGRQEAFSCACNTLKEGLKSRFNWGHTVMQNKAGLKKTHPDVGTCFARFNKLSISVVVAKEALKDLLALQSRQIAIGNIQKTVAGYYKVKIDELKAADENLPRDYKLLIG